MWPFNKNQRQAQANFAPVPAPIPQASSAPVAQAPVPRTTSPVVMERPAPQSIDVRAEHIKSVIAQDEYFEGHLRFQRGIKIDGHVKGNIEFGITDGMLVVNDKARVEGNIYGPRAIIVGGVTGDIIITGRLIVLPQAKIRGDIAAGTLQFHEGASIEGRICTVNDLQQKTHEHPEAPQAPTTGAPEAQAEVLRFAVGGAGQGR